MHDRAPLLTTFPDPDYLANLVAHEQARFDREATDTERLLTLAGVSMNWLADILLDPNIEWMRQTLLVDDLYLTGTIPEWNKVIIDECQRSPRQLRERLAQDLAVRALFASVTSNPIPLLVRFDDDKYKVFDGMHRTIAAIRDDHTTIEAYVGRLATGKNYRPVCEPHVVYDVLRPFLRKINTDKVGLRATLRYLLQSYSNVADLLKHRFNHAAVPDEEVQLIISEVLMTESDVAGCTLGGSR